jgi:hypothetical protein
MQNMEKLRSGATRVVAGPTVRQAQQAQPTVLPPPTRYVEPPSQYEQLVAQYQRGEYDSAVVLEHRT